MTSNPYLHVDSVWKSFDNHSVLRGISLEVLPHTATVLIGASGSGKSTLLRCINGLETVDAGSITIDGDLDVTAFNTDLDAVRRRVGIVFQSFNLFPHMKVIENIILGPTKVLKQRVSGLNYLLDLASNPSQRITLIDFPVVKLNGWRSFELWQ
jgi:polar amino acid transport system ATP-binding protein